MSYRNEKVVKIDGNLYSKQMMKHFIQHSVDTGIIIEKSENCAKYRDRAHAHTHTRTTWIRLTFLDKQMCERRKNHRHTDTTFYYIMSARFTQNNGVTLIHFIDV